MTKSLNNRDGIYKLTVLFENTKQLNYNSLSKSLKEWFFLKKAVTEEPSKKEKKKKKAVTKGISKQQKNKGKLL